MDILIAFATTEGHTRKIAQHLEQQLERGGHAVEIFNCSDEADQPDVGRFDAVILAASVHDKRYQPAFYSFVSANKAALKSKPLAFVSVSLAITLADGEQEAQSYVDNFVKETGLKIENVHLAEGAIRYLEYSGSEESTIKLIVFKSQKKMPPHGSNPEYTDWNALDAFAKSFAQSVPQSKSDDAKT